MAGLKLLHTFALLVCASVVPGIVYGQEGYPSRSVRIVAPYAAGGTPDTVARLLAEQLTSRLKQTFFVENRPGANGMIATENVASSPPDGYTLLLGSDGPIVITPLLRRSEDALSRVMPVNLTAESAFVLMARSDLDVSRLSDVVALAKKENLTFASAGVGSQHHLAGELLKSRAGINLVHVPYKGSAEGLTDLMGKRIDLMFGGIPPALPYIAGGHVKAIAVTSETRSPKLASVRTFSEEGFPNYKVAFWVGILAPVGTPKPVVDQLNRAIEEIMKSPNVIERLEKIGVDPVNLGPQGFADRIQADKQMWGNLISQTGLVLK